MSPRQRQRQRLFVVNDPQTSVINKALAQEIGLTEAVVLMQLEFLISISDNEREGRYWTYQSLTDLRDNYFPYWSKATIGRAIQSLVERELLIVGNYNQVGFDRTPWYALNPSGLRQLSSIRIDMPSSQIETTMIHDETPSSQIETRVSHPASSSSRSATPIPETTSETTSERDGSGPTRIRPEEFVPDPGDPGRVAAAVAQVAAELRDEAHPDHTTRRAWEGYVAAGVGFEAWLGAVDYARRMALRTWTTGAESRMPAFWRALEGRLGERARRTA